MNVPSATDATGKSNSAGPTTTTSSNGVDYNTFLQLLVAEMKNQDPTKPMDSTQYVAQLATFSQVEQTVKTNTKLDALLTSAALTQVDGVIGRTVSTVDGTVSGVVTSVVITNEGAVAKLKGGEALLLGPGVVVS